MDVARFDALAAAWGGALDAWPEAVRAEARGFVAANPVEAARVLRRAAALDAALESLPRPAVPASLRDAVIASAPKPRPWARLQARWAGWISGAGLAAACAAGLACGVFAAQATAGADLRAEELMQSASDIGAVALPSESKGVS